MMGVVVVGSNKLSKSNSTSELKPKVNYDLLHLIMDVYKLLLGLFRNLPISFTLVPAILIYLDRISERIKLRRNNWAPMLVGASSLAAKMWEDLGIMNEDFIGITNYKIRDLKDIEHKVYSLLDLNLNVSREEFEQYHELLSSQRFF